MNRLIKKANVLIEALPYIRTFKGKTVVDQVRRPRDDGLLPQGTVCAECRVVEYVGINPVIIHGGGPQIDKMLDRLGIEAKFRHGSGSPMKPRWKSWRWCWPARSTWKSPIC